MTGPAITSKLLQWQETPFFQNNLCFFFFFGFGFIFFSFFLGVEGASCLGFCFLGVLGVAFYFFLYLGWLPLYIPIGLKYPLSSLFGLLLFRWLLEACQECSFSCYSFFTRLTKSFYLCRCLPSCTFPWFYPSCFLGLVLNSISGLFKFFFACFHLFHRVLQAIQYEVK